ncbi:MAG: CehA/McbA family metallohydrolase [Chloroflexi bacterium]|nr:CehA/McbA family metallohydrolase [Chloroflexota bacterium]
MANPYRSQGWSPLKVETHLHTLHSDGQSDVQAMLGACRQAGYAVVGLTDHNTQSGLAEARLVGDAERLLLLPGVEVTTFHGHAVVLGVSVVPEWRDLEARGIDALAADVHAQGGVLCVCHPVAFGSPYCSGCAWEWPIAPESIDLWEVFSSTRAGNPYTDLALLAWEHQLRRGSHAAPVAAGDVHSARAAAAARAATYVYTRQRSPEAALDGLRQRRLFASAGPRVDLWLEHGSRTALCGESVAEDAWRPYAEAESGHRPRIRELRTARGRCVYAELRDASGGLLAVSAPIWIE